MNRLMARPVLRRQISDWTCNRYYISTSLSSTVFPGMQFDEAGPGFRVHGWGTMGCARARAWILVDLAGRLIDLSKCHVPKTFIDKVAYRIVKILRIPADIMFKRRYGRHAMMLETVAAVPGMVGGMLLHLRSLRKFQQSGGWIKALFEEAENERMHLMTMVELVQLKWYERLLVLTVQGVFFNGFFVLYLLSPKLAHRIVGYLEEEAVHLYTK